MNVGFTGSRQGMTIKQEESFINIISKIDIGEFHHGDCIGSDKEAHGIIKENATSVRIFVHPPRNGRNRAFCKGDFQAPEKNYLVRDKEIVEASDMLIATPCQDSEVIRSGTWTTIRYAKKARKKIMIIYPSGIVRKIGCENE